MTKQKTSPSPSSPMSARVSLPTRTFNVELDPLDPVLEPMPGNRAVSQAGIPELAASLQTVGQLHSIQVLDLPDGRRWIAAGVRRWMAAKHGKFPIRADIWVCEGETQALGAAVAEEIRLAENLHRAEPTVYEVAEHMRNIRNERGCTTIDEVAHYVALQPRTVKQYLSLLRASDMVRAAINEHRLGITLAATLVAAERRMASHPKKFRQWLQEACADRLSSAELERRLRALRETGSVKRAARKVAAKSGGASGSVPVSTLARRVAERAQTHPKKVLKELPGVIEELRALMAELEQQQASATPPAAPPA